MGSELKMAVIADLPVLLPLVREFHETQDLSLADHQRVSALKTLLANAELGGIWLIFCDSQPVGYIALCMGYSIEFAGKDAFIDEFYIRPAFQGKGLGTQTLKTIKVISKEWGIKALHLEVLRSNLQACQFYANSSFQPRTQYMLMSVNL